MINHYYWPTPNGWKTSIMLEECSAIYETIYIDIAKGDQFNSDFLSVSPNNRMPAIVDYDPMSGFSDPVSIFESGAILLYLAEKYDCLLPKNKLKQKEVKEWIFWQVANQSPASGQLSHFRNFASENIDYAISRYSNEYRRCLAILNTRLEFREYIVDDYSIADVICWPWVLYANKLGENLDEYPHLQRWRSLVKARPAVQRGVALGSELRRTKPYSEKERNILFNQNGQ